MAKPATVKIKLVLDRRHGLLLRHQEESPEHHRKDDLPQIRPCRAQGMSRFKEAKIK